MSATSAIAATAALIGRRERTRIDMAGTLLGKHRLACTGGTLAVPLYCRVQMA
jgi:hypothetical protein